MQLHRYRQTATRDEVHMQTLKELAIPLLKERSQSSGGGGSSGGSGGGAGTLAASAAARVAALPISLQNIAYVSVLRRAVAQAAAEANAAAAVAAAAAAAATGAKSGRRPAKLSFSVRDILDLPEVKSGCSSPHPFIGANGQSPVVASVGGGGTGVGGASGGGVAAADLCGGPAAWTTAGHVHGNPAVANAAALGQDLGASSYSLHYGGVCSETAYRWFHHPTPDMLSYGAL
ncbi:hypothetical protein V5799_018369, partial [Amblyomma americanum]